MDAIDAVFYIAILVMSVVIHEVAHGFAALYFGDQTARHAGRLTLNPLKHLDPFGSVILPALLLLTHSPILLGWAKPVPYNPDNLSNERLGSFTVAIAGVAANLFIALVFGILIRFVPSEEFSVIASIIVLLNLSLAIFNLVPIPPLDGSKILFALLPDSSREIVVFFESYALVLLLIFIVFFSQYLYPIVIFFYRVFTGLQI